MLTKAKEIIDLQIATLNNIPLDNIEEAVSLLKECNGKIVFLGVGKAGIIAKKIAATMSSTGTPAIFVSPSEAVHGDLGIIQDQDIIVALSNSGKTQEVLLALSLCKKAFTCKVIGICGSANSEMGTYCDLVLEIGTIKEACPFGLAPTSSTLAMLAIGDILSVLLMEVKEFTLEDYALRHHSGYINFLIKEKLSEK